MTASSITLLTDFGTADGYVAELKGVLATQAPGVALLDMSHDVPAHDIEHARLTLARYWRRFPVGTVHLVVVDPGVGTSRAAIAVESDGRFLVGPDNGVLSPALFALDARVVSLPVDPHASPTFHGRDVFAPAAARVACGAALDHLGEPMHEPVRRRTPQPRRLADGSIDGEVLTIDRFGNVMTNLVANLVARHATVVRAADQTVRVVRTYGDAAPGELVALVGSSGFIELAVRDGNAARQCRLERGARVVLLPAA
jgi:S-adenosyl-L-methionine hydrolase (adenosine-forming)